MEIKKEIAFDNNNLASFRKKWASFKQNNLIYTLNLSASDKQADGGWRTIYISYIIFADFVFLFLFLSLSSLL